LDLRKLYVAMTENFSMLENVKQYASIQITSYCINDSVN